MLELLAYLLVVAFFVIVGVIVKKLMEKWRLKNVFDPLDDNPLKDPYELKIGTPTGPIVVMTNKFNFHRTATHGLGAFPLLNKRRNGDGYYIVSLKGNTEFRRISKERFSGIIAGEESVS